MINLSSLEPETFLKICKVHSKKKSQGERKSLTSKENASQQKKNNMFYVQRKCLTPKENFSQQNKEKVKNNSD